MENRLKKVFKSHLRVEIMLLMVMSLLGLFFTYPSVYIFGGLLVFFVFFISGIRYVISEEKLYVKIWMITSRSITISDIISIERSRNSHSSTIVFFKRPYIGIGRKMLISPVREQEYIDSLCALNPKINIRY